MRKKIVAGNWKMNTQINEGLELINKLLKLHNCDDSATDQVIIFPPFTHLTLFHNILKDSCMALGAQNLNENDKGAFTGEISADMIKASGCEYVIIGHSERRQYYQEDNDLLAKKTNIALEKGLIPVYCCGEKLEERESGDLYKVVEEQLTKGLFHLSKADFEKVIIAYEPVWAIGTGKTATPGQAQEMHQFIRGLIQNKYGTKTTQKCSILYGGSVKGANAKELFAQEDIDGGLVGGASLKPDDFNLIINAM